MITWIDDANDFFTRIAVRIKRGTMPDYYRQIFDTPAGRIVLADLHRKAGVMLTHEGWENDQLKDTTGRRDMVLYIDGMLRMRPQALQQIAEMETINE